MSSWPTIARPGTVAVAYSGGRDSLALLHATVRAAREVGCEVVALHVHHGLVADADAWVHHAIRLCDRWQRAGWPLRLRWHRVEGTPAPGQSIEAWARRHRYDALARMAREEGASLVLLAHHRRDQAETVLLQALRGAGARGLAAMPRLASRDGLSWARPWLDQPREAIDTYVRRHRLRPLEDPSNQDARLARNRLRMSVWPAMSAAFPGAEQALVQVARRAQQDQALCAEVASLDLATLAHAGGLQRAPWLALSVARRANVLRLWLGGHLTRGAPEALVQQLLRDWPADASGRWTVRDERELVAYRGLLRWGKPAVTVARGGPEAIDLSRPQRIELPTWGGALVVEPVRAAGVDPALLRGAELRARAGGERFQRAARTPPRSLKKAYQLAGLAADQRQGPLIWAAGRLLFVPGLGIDARAWAGAGQPQLSLRWVPLAG